MKTATISIHLVVLWQLVLALTTLSAPADPVYAWSNFAGQPGGAGNVDGTGSAARFNYPYGVAVDSAGNVYVADSYNNTIRKVTAGGEATTVAGLAGSSGTNDGTGSVARFFNPSGVAVDSAGNVYVADAGNHTIRKVTAGGEVTTLAGLAEVSGSDDGMGSAARFYHPSGVAVDSAGNVYVADSYNNTIRKVTAWGEVTTLAGLAGYAGRVDGTGSAARFNGPAGVALDSAGNVYVADYWNHTIRKVAAGGVVITLAGLPGSSGSADGTGSAARFNGPECAAVDSAGNVYVSDAGNYTIRKVTAEGMVTTLVGLAGSSGSADGKGSAARFWNPTGVAMDSAGNVYVSDAGNHTIRKVTAVGMVTTLAGLAGSSGSADGTCSAARFNGPECVAVDSAGNIYVADYWNHTIRKVTAGGEVTTLAGLAGSSGSADGTGSAARFYHPSGVAVDSAGNVYVADRDNHTIRKATAWGVVTTPAGLAGSWGSADGTSGTALFRNPYGLAVDSAGNIYVADTGNHTIRKVTAGGVVTTLTGLAGGSGSADGTGSAARFNYPRGAAVDGAGNLYVADSGNHTIRKVSAEGVVTTLAGRAGISGSADGTGSTARFNYPRGVVVDCAGNLYVADSGNNTIRKVTPGGVVTTLAGRAGISGSDDGTSSAAAFYYPSGVAVDGAGNVYVADSGNHTIRKVTAGGVVTTLAGLAGSSGSADGTRSTARFWYPAGTAVDSASNIYVADTYNNTIRKVTPRGDVTTLAGRAGISGSDDGTGSAARFNRPSGVAVDSAGNVYVADSGNNAIRKVTVGGVVTTLAGLAGSWGSDDGTGGAARFNYPSGVAVDSAGNVYVADRYNNTIRKVTAEGAVTTLAGLAGSLGSADGTGSATRFWYPAGVAVDGEGNVYVADYFNHTIRKVTAEGAVTTLAGLAGGWGSADGTGSAARFNYPRAVAVDSAGNIYLADQNSHTIRKVTVGGEVTTIGGTAGVAAGADGTGGAAQFSSPSGVAVDSAGNLYVADSRNNRISKGLPVDLPTLLIRCVGNSIVVSWPDTGSYTLQQNSAVANPSGWATTGYSVTTANGTNSITISAPAEDQFFRLAQ